MTDTTRRPRITLVVFAYNQSAMIDAAIDSALAQVCEPIEILLSDDASPDDTFARMQAKAAAYQGPHLVRVRRNAGNLGINGHFNAVVEAAQGELLVMMAGDDLSLPERVARVAQAWDASEQRLDLIASHLVDMSPEGEDLGVVRVDDLSQWRTVEDWAQRRPYIIGAAHAFTRRLFERFGPLLPRVSYEDQVNLLRALCGGGACTIDSPLVRYRRGGVSDRMREFSGERFLAWVRRLNVIHIALHQQWLQDAARAGCLDVVQRAIEREYQRERFVAALLEAPGALSRWRLALRPSPVDFGWRVRKCVYLAWPGLAAAIRAAQSANRQRRRGQGR
jgi:glycosyltransferase involved in cell wall biosynthesis